ETLEDLRTGDVVARLSAERSTGFAQRAIPFDDSLHDELERVQVLVAPSALRSDLAAWGAAPHALEKMRALKARFDPQRTLAPGRFIGHI
ncbi:MAG TPA: hypothetical protein VKG44_08250, partial [Candidatus Baltobacteraceae bacterium]|nr:hypothetical protein [Candidatus Baltobacteraceae bacterium]